MLDKDKIVENLERFYSLIKTDSRSEQLMKMYSEIEDELATAPASPKIDFHNAFPGGYLDHILRVHDISIKLTKLYAEEGGVLTFTPTELRFSALHHDLGKIGGPAEPYYLPQDSEWHRKNRGEVYKLNNTIQYMNVTDRALFMLQKYGIGITQNEWLAIHLSDGMYHNGNDTYLKNNVFVGSMKTYLPHIIHMADYMSTIVEKGDGNLL